MPFLSLSLYNFRNIRTEKLNLNSKEIFFVGKNGQGKTNLIEAIYYASYGSSFRTHNDFQLIKEGCKEFSINFLYTNDDKKTSLIYLAIAGNKKIIKKDGKTVRDRKELITNVPCILFCHSDLKFVIGEPEYKRFFLDQSLSLIDNCYIDEIRKYKTILKNRNIVLKEKKIEILDIINSQYASQGLIIEKKRKDVVFQMNQLFSSIYENISGICGVYIKYLPSWKQVFDKDLYNPSCEEVLLQLQKDKEKELIMGTSLSGPHRDKFIFIKDNMNFTETASTGQQRLLSIVLRIVQSIILSRNLNVKPVILMDDVMMELDVEKRKKILGLLPEYDQLFCSFLKDEPYIEYKKSTTSVLEVSEGIVNEE